jgi:MOB kinase activator 1
MVKNSLKRIASNLQDFLNFISLFYSTINEYCSCPIMSVGEKQFLWQKSIKMTAAQYIDLSLSSAETLLLDKVRFPTKSGIPFPKDFRKTVKSIFKLLFRILGHIFYSHYDTILETAQEVKLS